MTGDIRSRLASDRTAEGSMQQAKGFPNLFLVGAPKCGTTSMAFYLGQHPEVFVPSLKEPTYFGRDLTFFGTRQTEEDYLALFQDWGPERYALDASTAYLCSRSAPIEIRNCATAPRILVMVRNPVEAAYSQYFQNVFDGAEFLNTFEDSFLAQDKRSSGELMPLRGTVERLLYSHVYQYSSHIRRYRDAFGPERVHVIVFDDFIADIRVCLDEVAQFLELEPFEAIRLEVKNPAKKALSPGLNRLTARPPQWMRALARTFFSRNERLKLRNAVRRLNTVPAKNPPMSPETRRILMRHFAPEVEKLSALLARDLTHWVKAKP